MATQAELQQIVDETTAEARKARTAWKESIPGADAPKMTDEEQAVVDGLENDYHSARATRKKAENNLQAAITAAAEAQEAAEAAEKERAKKEAEEAAAKAAADAALAKKAAADAGTPVGSKGLSTLDKKWILEIAGPRGLTDKAWAAQIAGPRPDGWTGV